MLDKKPVPSLSSRGWVSDVIGKMDMLLANFLTSDYSQTELYLGNISSMQYLVKVYGNDPRTFSQELQRKLEDYIGRYFDAVQVKVETWYIDTEMNDGPYGVKIVITGVVSGQRINLMQEFEIRDSKFKKIINN